MPIDPTPTSSYVQDCYNQGATRSVRTIGIDPAIMLNSLRFLAAGRSSIQGIPSRKLESLEDTTNVNGVSAVHMPLALTKLKLERLATLY